VIRRLVNWPAEVVARAPASIFAKLLTAFLVIAALLVIVGVVGLAALDTVNLRTEELVKIQRKIAAYRQLQHDTIAQLYSVASALVVPDERTLDATLRQLNQFAMTLTGCNSWRRTRSRSSSACARTMKLSSPRSPRPSS
jgi:hypothetical protein